MDLPAGSLFAGPWTTDLVRCLVCQLDLFDAFRMRQCSKLWREVIDFVLRERPIWVKATLLKWLKCVGNILGPVRSVPDNCIHRRKTIQRINVKFNVKLVPPEIPEYILHTQINYNDVSTDCGCHLCGKPMYWTRRFHYGHFLSVMRKQCLDVGCALGREIARIRNLCVCEHFDREDAHCRPMADDRCSNNYRCPCSQKSTKGNHHCLLRCQKLTDVMPCFALKK